MIDRDTISKGFPTGSLDHVELKDLPVGTVINDLEEGYFEKASEDFWESLYDHCGDCGTRVYQDEITEAPNRYPSIFGNAEVYFKDWVVVRVPYISSKAELEELKARLSEVK